MKNNKYNVKDLFIKPISKARFDRMLPRTKRLKIAEDVLARLKVGKIKPVRGKYFEAANRQLANKIYKEQVQNYSFSAPKGLLEKDAKTFVNEELCEVCAKGACMLSWVANFNEKIVK